ncbi:MAG: hypothetical protein QW585_00710 [Candidatus Pacearchaeota archaeon]
MSASKKNKRAQVWALDLAIGLTVFVGLIFMFYRYSVSFVPEQTTLEKMIRQGGLISSSLLSEGYPPDWATKDVGSQDVYMFGLLSNGILNASKWSKFCQWSTQQYSITKQKLGSEFGFYIYFDKNNDKIGEQIEDCNETGISPPDNATQVVKLERLVAYNDSGTLVPMKMIFYLWSYQKT